jgi:hypothetical protein
MIGGFRKTVGQIGKKRPPHGLHRPHERIHRQEKKTMFSKKLQTNRTEARVGRISAKRAAGVVAIQIAVLTAGLSLARADGDSPSAASASPTLTPVDYNFVAQANLGAPFQIDSGRAAEKKATTAAIRDYAHLMVVTHIPVVEALNKILQQKNIQAPENTLLQGAYSHDGCIPQYRAESGG